MSQVAPVEERRLTSWKEIAAYFGNDQRTVKRWESTRGLPVRRLPGARSGVFALVSEIEAWQRGEAVAVQASESTRAGSDFSLDEKADPVSLEAELPAKPAAPTEEAVAFADGTTVVDETKVQEAAAQGHGTAEEELAELRPSGDQSVRKSRHKAWHKGRLAIFWRPALTVAALALVASIALWHREVRGAVNPPHVPLPRAKELYLQGRFLWNKRTPDALRAALADFEEAARIDPQYAAAYAGVADCYALSPQFDPRPGSEVYPRMLAASQKALALDALLPEGHRALAFALFYWQFDLKASRAEFEEALRLAPHDATTHLWFANTLATSGLYEQALAEVQQAREIDPASPSIMADRAWILYRAHRREEARLVWTRLEETDPDYTMVHTWLAGFYQDMHQPEKFLNELKSISRLTAKPYDARRLQAARTGLRKGGEPGMNQALAEFEEQEFRRGNAGPYSVSVAMLRAARKEDAIEYLERSFRTRDQFVPGLAQSDVFSPLREMPRFQELVFASERPYREDPTPQALLTLPASSH